MLSFMTEDAKKAPSHESDKFVLRFAPGSDTRERIRKLAKENNRSMNAELLYRIESGMAPPDLGYQVQDAPVAYIEPASVAHLAEPQQHVVQTIINALSAQQLNLVLVDRISRNLDAALTKSGKTLTESERIGIIQQLYDKYTGADPRDEDLAKEANSAAA